MSKEGLTVGLPLLLTLIAGASTCVGGFLGVLTKKPSKRILAFSLGFAAGIMLLISLMEMLPAALNMPGISKILCYSAFLFGLICYFIIDKMIPHAHAHDFTGSSNNSTEFSTKKLKRTTVLLTLGISLHNFPEGIATFVTSATNLDLGIGIALAVTIHNIPEGLAISTPVYMVTGSKSKAIFWSAFSGLTEVLGGLLAYFILDHFITPTFVAITIAAVAGIMVALSIDELIPLAKETHPEDNPSFGILFGMSIMGLSLILLENL